MTSLFTPMAEKRPIRIIVGDKYTWSENTELRRAIRVQERLICLMQDDLEYSRTLCQPHAVSFWGPIQDTDTGEMEVTVLHRIGENRYFWPRTADILWYKVPEFVVGLIQELQPVTQRHLQIIPSVWREIKMQLNLD